MPHLQVLCIPIPQPRQRSAMIAGQVRTYTPTRHPVNVYKAELQLAFAQQCGGWPVADEPLWVRVLFVLPLPVSKRRKSQPGRRHCGCKPDLDNLLKSTIDALTGLAWTDDGRIAQCDAVKVYGGVDETPHVEIEFGTFTGGSFDVHA